MEEKKYTKLYIKIVNKHLDYILELVDESGFSPSLIINSLFDCLDKVKFKGVVMRAFKIKQIVDAFEKKEAEREERLRCGNA